jgi:outer membrane protein
MRDRSRSRLGYARRQAFVILSSCGLLLSAIQVARAEDTQAREHGSVAEDVTNISCPLEHSGMLSLGEAVDLALCNNAQIRVAWASIRVQAAAVGEARAAYWPSLSVVGTELNERTSYPGSQAPSSDRTEPTVFGSLTWHLFDFGGRAATRHAAQGLLAAAVASRDAMIQKVLGSTVQLYFAALTDKSLLDNKTEDETLARATLASAQRKQAEGNGARSDVLQAATAVAKSSLEQHRAQGEYQKARAELVYVLGLPADVRISLPVDVDVRSGSEQQDLQDWLREAEQRHPAIVAARANLEAARAEVVSARSAGQPTVDLTGNYYQNGFPQQGLTGSNTRVTTVGISVSIPLFDGFLTHYKVHSAKALAEAKEAELDDTRQQTLKDVVAAYAEAETSLENLSVSQELLSTAEAALESTQRRYKEGVTNIVELLSTQAALVDARGERVQSLAAWRSARLRLLASAGVLNRAAL